MAWKKLKLLKNGMNIWLENFKKQKKKEKMKNLSIYLSIFGGILLFIIICLIIRSNKKANLEKRAMLQNELESP